MCVHGERVECDEGDAIAQRTVGFEDRSRALGGRGRKQTHFDQGQIAVADPMQQTEQSGLVERAKNDRTLGSGSDLHVGESVGRGRGEVSGHDESITSPVSGQPVIWLR